MNKMVSFPKVFLFFILCCFTNLVSDAWYYYSSRNIDINKGVGYSITFEEKLSKVPVGFVITTIIGGIMFYSDIKNEIKT